jgi:hypothetical protein
VPDVSVDFNFWLLVYGAGVLCLYALIVVNADGSNQ